LTIKWRSYWILKWYSCWILKHYSCRILKRYSYLILKWWSYWIFEWYFCQIFKYSSCPISKDRQKVPGTRPIGIFTFGLLYLVHEYIIQKVNRACANQIIKWKCYFLRDFIVFQLQFYRFLSKQYFQNKIKRRDFHQFSLSIFLCFVENIIEMLSILFEEKEIKNILLIYSVFSMEFNNQIWGFI
jgi:hypothetical protein